MRFVLPCSVLLFNRAQFRALVDAVLGDKRFVLIAQAWVRRTAERVGFTPPPRLAETSAFPFKPKVLPPASSRLSESSRPALKPMGIHRRTTEHIEVEPSRQAFD
jgi:hypothetical protein